MVQRFINQNASLIIIIILGLILVSLSGFYLYKSKLKERQEIIVATNSTESDSYRILKAVARIVEEEDYDFSLQVVSTEGSAENLLLLDSGLVQMATIQADLQVQPDTRLVMRLYQNVFHLIFRPDVEEPSIEKIKGMKVAIPPAGSGGYEAFYHLKEHFKLTTDYLQPVVTTWESATWLFMNNDIDVIFRVLEPNHPDIVQFVTTMPSYNGSITQAEAISLYYPMYQKAMLPRGTYTGLPPKPTRDIPTLGVDMLLVANENTPADVVKAISEILLTRKRDLVDVSKLAGSISIPQGNTLIPWHQGLSDYVNKSQPNFFQENAEFLALILSILVFLGSSLLQIINRNKQQRLNSYNEQLLSIKINVEQTGDLNELIKLREEHYALVNQIVADAVRGRITNEGFEFFAFAWDSVIKMIRDKETQLRR